MLLYAVLHLTGYDMPLEELKRFRQWASRCPGHPERGVTPGVEVTKVSTHQRRDETRHRSERTPR